MDLSILHTVNFHNPSWDAFIFFVWLIASLLYSFSAGRGRIISILIAVYMAELLVIQAPFLSNAVESQLGGAVYLGRLITFLVLFAFLFMVLSHFVFRTSVENRGFSSWFFSLIFAILQIGFLISVILSFLPLEIKNNFAPLVKFVFISPTASFAWLVLPIVFIVMLGRHLSDHRHMDV
jgi:hypothetical protein